MLVRSNLVRKGRRPGPTGQFGKISKLTYRGHAKNREHRDIEIENIELEMV
jgi:hypothetical protein